MKTFKIACILPLVCGIPPALAQPPEIIGVDSDTGITFQSPASGEAFSLEFATSLSGPWTNWGAATDQPITGAVMNVPTPLYFRIRDAEPSVISDPALNLHIALQGYDANHDLKIQGSEIAAVTNLTMQGAWTW